MPLLSLIPIQHISSAYCSGMTLVARFGSQYWWSSKCAGVDVLSALAKSYLLCIYSYLLD